jgi:hypothetical protein
MVVYQVRTRKEEGKQVKYDDNPGERLERG